MYSFLVDFMVCAILLGVTRVWGNRKGVLDRQRQPKPVTYLVRERYNSLARGDSTLKKMEGEAFTVL